MELIESTFSGTSDRVEKGAEAQKRAAPSLHTVGSQKKASPEPADSEAVEGNEEREGSFQSSKAASASGLEQEKAMASGHAEETNGLSGENDGDTPRKLPAAKTPGSPLRPPVTPRKNVIPSRRASFDNARAPSAPQRSTPPVDDAQAEDRDKRPATFEAGQPPSWSGSPQHTVEQPTRAALPVTSANALAGAQATALPASTNLAAAYHDTSAAEEAWQAAHPGDELSEQDTHILAVASQSWAEDQPSEDRQSTAEINQRASVAAIETRKMEVPVTPLPSVLSMPAGSASVIDIPTTPLPALAPVKPLERQKSQLSRKKALLMAVLLAILVLNATAAGFSQAFGVQGWASVWDNQTASNQNLLTQIAQRLQHSPTPGGGTATATPPPTPTQVVNLLMSNMTLDEKLGQMMMVQFTGPAYSPQLDAMISQYKVGSVLVFAANGNIVSKTQLKALNSQMQKNAFLPLAISIDQEGGTVDRLIDLDGPQPAAATIGATGDPHNAYEQGIKDAQDLTSYGFNLNLAPVVDVTNVYNPQLYNRTYGNTPAIVTSMAGAYLQGLQKSGEVMGTLKHFPGLGDVSVDPHYRPPDLTRSLNDLNSIDWAPYSNLIKQGNVYAIMVTHEYVKALDTKEPSSLSRQVVDVLRKQMHFQGVIMTDSLTMDSISNYYSYGQAAALAVEAGDDLLMGASSLNDLASMIEGIKQAITAGTISQQQIDASVRRILLLKYEMGLIHV